MLTETLLAATAAPDSSAITNATGLHVHELQPVPSLKHTFKKSSSRPNCLAVSKTHIFAAQSDKSVVHVYNRERNNLETTIPFPEKVSALCLAGGKDGVGILVLGTEAGRIILWELGTGRQIFTPSHHLRPITSLVVNLDINFVASGSADSTVHIWSLPRLLSFLDVSQGTSEERLPHWPWKSLTTHRSPVTALVFGHSASRHDILISASKDGVCMVWDYHVGSLLRTFLLQASPSCLALDPADRALYVGYGNGHVHFVDFYKAATVTHPLYDKDLKSTATEVPLADKWPPPPGNETSAIWCLDVSFVGTKLVSGHESGHICIWDTAKRRFEKQLTHFQSPVTNLIVLEPTGFPVETLPPAMIQTVVKPRYETFNDVHPGAGSSIPHDYTFTARFTSELSLPGTPPGSDFHEILRSPCFPPHMLEETLAELGGDGESEADPSAVADLKQEKAAISLQLQSAVQEIGRRDGEARRRKHDEEIKAARKKRRRLQRLKQDEAGRKKEMGEIAFDAGEMEIEDEPDLSSSTDELGSD